MKRIWANSADSHALEPDSLFWDRMAPDLADRMPRSVVDEDGQWETIYVDGQSFRRRTPRPIREGDLAGMSMGDIFEHRAPGANDPALRLKDLDQEGIWAEVIFPSIGLWNASIRDPGLMREGARVVNDWAHESFLLASPRYVPTASLSLLSVDDAVHELQRTASMGFRAVFLPPHPPLSQPDFHRKEWDPLWSAAEDSGTIIAFHIGSEPVEIDEKRSGHLFGGPGGAVLNYVETTYGGQRAVTKLVASGALDRHPGLKVLVAEAGAAWAPFLGDRMNEAYRQHSAWVEPKLSLSPKEYIYRQVYASFQHDPTAVQTVVGMGWQNVLWGSDYPHLEGTFGHTQETLHELFDDVSDEVRHRITVGAFQELFPGLGDPPTE